MTDPIIDQAGVLARLIWEQTAGRDSLLPWEQIGFSTRYEFTSMAKRVMKARDQYWWDLANALCLRAEKAEAERDEIAGRLSELLCELTDGLLSKTGYDVRTMVSAVESIFEGHAERDRADVIAERDALAATVQRVRGLADAHRGTHDRECHCNDWSTISPNEIYRALDDPQEQP